MVLALAACGPRSTPVAGFRDAAVPIYSSAVFDAATLAGDWRQVAEFAEAPGCRASGVRFVPVGAVLQIDGQLCLAGKPVVIAGMLRPVGPGRFGLPGVPEPVWVLWADTDVRTLVLGTPSGRFGLILNRGADLPGDRLVAAREVLAWNGYDLDRLRVTP